MGIDKVYTSTSEWVKFFKGVYTMIYFICDGDWEEGDSCIKVGYSKNGGKGRLYEFQTGNPRELSLAFEITGSLKFESALHELFKEFHVRGEWFKWNEGFVRLLYEFFDEHDVVRKRVNSCKEERSLNFLLHYYESQLLSWIFDKLEGGI